MDTRNSTQIDRRYIVLSDLHATTGLNKSTGRWSTNEDFWDEIFEEFLIHFNDGNTTLIINGDFFDFMQVIVSEFTENDYIKYPGLSPLDLNPKYGLKCTEPAMTLAIDLIAEGHEVLFRALAEFALNNKVVITKGNHDVQLYWVKVQIRIKEILKTYQPNLNFDNIEFRPWCYYVKDLFYIEHGNQYEDTTSFSNFLYPMLPEISGENKQLELDLSSFLVRYLTNAIEPINPLADNIRPISMFWSELFKKYPTLIIGIFIYALKYVVKIFSIAKKQKKNSESKASKSIIEENKRLIIQEAEFFSIANKAEFNKLSKAFIKFENNKFPVTLEQGPFKFIFNLIKPSILPTLYLITFSLYSFFCVPKIVSILKQWFINNFNKDSIYRITSYLYDKNIFNVGLTILGAVLMILIIRNLSKSKSSSVFDVSRNFRSIAIDIANTLNVPIVIFGHTHYSDIHKTNNGRTYFNTGTWMGIFEETELLYRDSKQFTFVKIENGKSKLLRWNSDNKSIEKVIIMDTESVNLGSENRIFNFILKLLKIT